MRTCTHAQRNHSLSRRFLRSTEKNLVVVKAFCDMTRSKESIIASTMLSSLRCISLRASCAFAIIARSPCDATQKFGWLLRGAISRSFAAINNHRHRFMRYDKYARCLHPRDQHLLLLSSLRPTAYVLFDCCVLASRDG